jgi:hypothetical protein
MKNLIFIALFFMGGANLANAQVVVNSSNMPVPGDTMTRKKTTNLQGIDLSLTGSNYTWDYTALTPSSSVKDSFITVSTTPAEYSAIFSNILDSVHNATVSLEESFFSALQYISTSENYNYYKLKQDRYVQVGTGAKINGTKIPFPFTSEEKIYSLPIVYGSADTSNIFLGDTVPGFGYFGEYRRRINTVDGWGELRLPNQIFDVVRVKSVISVTDTFKQNIVPWGLTTSHTETEYNYWNPGFNEPVLSIKIVSGTLGSTRIKYIDNFIPPYVLVTSNDMPEPGDTIKRRSTTNIQGLNPNLTGMGYTWNFSSLNSHDSIVDTFVSVLSTPILYNVAYSNPLDQDRLSTVAAKQSFGFSPPTITITNVYGFFKNTIEKYTQTGIGMTINGVAIPMSYNPTELIYKFPITPGRSDSGIANMSATIPTFGYYGQKRNRTNWVDGWGTLILPHDTFDVVRVKSIIKIYDTIYINQFSFGLHFNRTETEYKWLTAGEKAPVLYIQKASGGGSNNYNIKYYDFFIDTSHAGINFIKDNPQDIKIFPNPAINNLHFTIDGSQTVKNVSIFDDLGQIIYKNSSISRKDNIDISRFSKGIYLIQFDFGDRMVTRKFTKQ